MLKIRLKRIGRKHDPSFRVVVTEVTAPPKGKYKEAVGFYNSALKQLKLNIERIKYWLSVGAQPTSSVHNLLVKEGVIEAQKQRAHSTRVRKSAAKEEKTKEAPIVKNEISHVSIDSQISTDEPKVDIKEPKTDVEEEKQLKEEKTENITNDGAEVIKEKNEKEEVMEEVSKEESNISEEAEIKDQENEESSEILNQEFKFEDNIAVPDIPIETETDEKIENKEQENKEGPDVSMGKSEDETSIPDVLVEEGKNIGEVAELIELNPNENLENDVKQGGGKSKKDKNDKAGDKEKKPEEREESLL